MRIFFSSLFMKKEELLEAQIKHPIKLEYYKIINEDEILNKNRAKFGIGIIKTEYIENNTKVEEKEIQYLSNDERKINDILTILKENEVTPVGVSVVVCDFSKQVFYLLQFTAIRTLYIANDIFIYFYVNPHSRKCNSHSFKHFLERSPQYHFKIYKYIIS